MRTRPAGTHGLLLDLASTAETVRTFRALAAAREARLLPWVEDLVPGSCTVLITAVPTPAGARALSALPGRLEGLLADQDAGAGGTEPLVSGSGPVVEIRVRYDGPDLPRVAELTGLTPDEVVTAHTAAELTVAFCGFSPGFAYLMGVPEKLRVPRRATPRTSVPAGSVGLAGEFSGVYPRSSPGGWQLVGRSDAVLWDTRRRPAALLTPGTRVRFRAVDEVASPTRPQERIRSMTDGVDAAGWLTLLDAGALTTVQDLGRAGLAHLGVPRGGAADVRSLRLANRLIGNAEGAAALENVSSGCRLRLNGPRYVAVTGAASAVRIGPRLVGADAAILLPAGAVLSVGRAERGVYTYVAIAGGIESEVTLGSRSTDLLSGTGPTPLGDGDTLPLGRPAGVPGPVDVAPVPDHRGPRTLRLVIGPRDAWFTDEALATLLHANYSVSPASNRIAIRLDGPPLHRAREGELPSEAVPLGAVQVPADGLPLVFLADHPTTGGYPVIGCVHADDIPLAAQSPPGTPIRFRRVG